MSADPGPSVPVPPAGPETELAAEGSPTKAAQGVEGVGCIEISDIRTVSASDDLYTAGMSVWSNSGVDVGSDVVPVPVDAVYNWPYVEEVFSTPSPSQCVPWTAGSEEGPEGRPQLRCSLSWDRILPEGEGLVLGPTKIEVRLSDNAPAPAAPAAPRRRGRSRRWRGAKRDSCDELDRQQEENNNLVNKLILKRPSGSPGLTRAARSKSRSAGRGRGSSGSSSRR